MIVPACQAWHRRTVSGGALASAKAAVDQEGKNRRGGSERAASGQRGEETEDLPARRAKPARNGSSQTRR
ncbi:hypothetical protein BGLA2_1280005 [Burkholderia gladioli]|nr:hypothetical protein BGLA2_1280005 [Burkholderia gladioli]